MNLDRIQTAQMEYKAAQTLSLSRCKALFQLIRENINSEKANLSMQPEDSDLTVNDELNDHGQLEGTATLFGHRVAIKVQHRSGAACNVWIDNVELALINANSGNDIATMMGAIFQSAVEYFERRKDSLTGA